MSKFCANCGAELKDDAKFCNGCGAKIPEGGQPQQQQQPQQQFQQQPQQPNQNQAPPNQTQGFQQNTTNFLMNTNDETASIDPADIEKNKVMGGLAYFLFFLPLVACPESKYGRFHANQGLLLLIVGVGLGVANAILTAIILAITWRLWIITSLLSFVVGIGVTVIGVIGLINGFSGKAKELPIIGKFRIIK